MSTFPRTPRVIKGGLVLADPVTGMAKRVIVFTYSPDSLSRTLQVQGAAGESGDRSEALRLKGPPVETIKLEAELDAVDQLEFPDQSPNQTVAQVGLYAHLAALETIVYPDSSRLQANNALAQAGTLEILPLESLLTLFVWSKNRILPVRITEFSITEEAFDPSLNPIRAKVSLSMRVLSVNDLSFSHKGANLFMVYQQQKEQFAKQGLPGNFSTLGIGGIA